MTSATGEQTSQQPAAPLDIFAVYRRCLNDVGFVQMTVDRFRDKIGAIADQLLLALGSGEIKEAHRLAHGLRSVAGQMSAAMLCETCFRIEDAAKKENLPGAIEASQSLKGDIARCIAYLPVAMSELNAAA